LCCSQKTRSQCNPNLYASFSAGYDCVSQQGFIIITMLNGTGPYTYNIVQPSNGATVASGTPATNTYSTPALPQGQYSAAFTDANGCMYNTSVIVAISYTAANINFPAGGTASVTCYGGSTGSVSSVPPSSFTSPLSYSWQPGGYTTPVVTGMPAGVYSVTVKDSKGCQVTNTVTVKEPPPILTTLTNTYITCFGYTMATPFTSTGNVSSTSYTLNGTPMVSSVASPVSAGINTIITMDSKGCVMTNTVLVSQGIQTTINFSINKPSCPGVSDGSVSTAVSTSTPPYSYTWQPGNSNNATLSNISTGTYTLTLQDANSCITKSTTIVSPAISATISAITSPENCSAADGSFTLNVTGVSPPFTFTTLPVGPHAGTSLANLSSGTYTTITNYNSTCIDTTYVVVGNLSTVSVSIQNSVAIVCYSNCTGSVMLSVQNAVLPVTYSATGMPATNTNIISNLCAGFYTIKVVDANGCPATATVNFVDPPQFTYSATAPSTACAGRQVNLQGSGSGGTGNYTFIWTPGNINGQLVGVVPAGTTVYTLNAFDSKGCTQPPVQLTVSVLPMISVSLPASGAGICPGSTAQITPTVSGGDGIYSYLWLPGSSTAPSVFVENITVPVYTLVVTDACGSPPAVKLVTINLFPATKPLYQVKGGRGCEPYCTAFINVTPRSGQAIWSFGSQSAQQTGDTTRYCYEKAGNYDLKLSVVDSNNCRAAYIYTNAITVMQSPKAGFMSLPEHPTLKTSENVLFSNTSENGTSYQWYSGSTLLGETQNIYYTFPDTGCYLFQLVAKNPQGCTDTLEKYVCVNEDFNFYMPNCFTPNDNGLNDVFMPKGTAWLPDNYLFEIYNRWGSRLFKTSEIGKGWDGSNAGASTPQNAFVWRVTVTDMQQVRHVFQGSVTLLR
jgi:gliding motility-associated-like protein